METGVLQNIFVPFFPSVKFSSCFSFTCCSRCAGELLIFSANFIHTAQSLHWQWSTLAYVASLFFSLAHHGTRRVLQSLIEANRYLSHLHLLEMPTWCWVCVLGLAQQYLWQIGFKLTVTGLLWHHRIIYVSEFRPLRSRFCFTTKNASVHLC